MKTEHTLRNLFISCILLLSLSIGAVACSTKENNQASGKGDPAAEMEAYRAALEKLEEADIKTMRAEAEKGETFYAYLGGESCPFCVLFAPTLAEVKEKHDIRVMHIDSDDQSQSDDLTSLIQELNFNTIPALFIIRDKKITRVPIKAPYTVEKVEKWLELNE